MKLGTGARVLDKTKSDIPHAPVVLYTYPKFWIFISDFSLDYMQTVDIYYNFKMKMQNNIPFPLTWILV